jgi:hypothetical protein
MEAGSRQNKAQSYHHGENCQRSQTMSLEPFKRQDEAKQCPQADLPQKDVLRLQQKPQCHTE